MISKNNTDNAFFGDMVYVHILPSKKEKQNTLGRWTHDHEVVGSTPGLVAIISSSFSTWIWDSLRTGEPSQ